MKITKRQLRQIIRENILLEDSNILGLTPELKDFFVQNGISADQHELLAAMADEWYHNEGGFMNRDHQDAQMRYEDKMGFDEFEDFMFQASKIYGKAWKKYDAAEFDRRNRR